MAASVSSDSVMSTFNAHTQNITLLYPDGSPFSLSLADVDQATYQSIKACVVFASQIGACGILLVLLATLTKPEKRKTVIFLMNTLSLILVIIRSVLQILYFTGPWNGFFAFYGGYYDDIPRSAYTTSIAASAMAVLLNISVQISLIFQVRVVYTSSPLLKNVMTMVSVLVGMISTAFYVATAVQDAHAILNTVPYISPWLYPTARALFTFSICFFSIIFTVKLWTAIHQRKKLGLESWGPLQIIFIVGCQTLVVPAIFSVLENVQSINFDGMHSFTSCLVAISLPISSMWAAASIHTSPTSAFATAHSGSESSCLMKNSKNSRNSRATTLTANSTGAYGRKQSVYSNSTDSEKFGSSKAIHVERSVEFDMAR